MSAYIVSYDLYKTGQNYECLKMKLEAYPVHWKMQLSVWVIETSQSATQVRDGLKGCLDANDKLFVGKLSGEAAWSGYTDNGSSWLKLLLEKMPA